MQEKLSKLKYKFKTEVKSGKSGYMLYAAVLAGIRRARLWEDIGGSEE